MTTDTPERKAATVLFDAVFEQIEAGVLDDIEDDTFPGGWEARDDAEPEVADVHHEATIRKVLTELAGMVTDRATGRVPVPLSESDDSDDD